MLGAHAHLVTRARRSVSLVMEFYMFSAMNWGRNCCRYWSIACRSTVAPHGTPVLSWFQPSKRGWSGIWA